MNEGEHISISGNVRMLTKYKKLLAMQSPTINEGKSSNIKRPIARNVST